MRKAIIRSGIGTPRSQKSPYFIELTPETHFVWKYLCRSEIDSKQPRKLLRHIHPHSRKAPDEKSNCSERSVMSTLTAQNRQPGRRPGFRRDPNEGDNQGTGLDSGRRFEPRAYGIT